MERMTASHCKTRLKKLSRSFDIRGFTSRNLKTHGKLGNMVGFGCQCANLDEGIISEVVASHLIVSSNNSSNGRSCDVEGDIANGSSHSDGSKVELERSCPKVESLVKAKT